MSSFSSVIEFVDDLRDMPLDIAVLNAAIIATKYEHTEDGWEST